MGSTHLYRDATEKVLFTCKSIQNKVCLLVSQYYILHVKLVFQCRPIGGEDVTVKLKRVFQIHSKTKSVNEVI